MKQALYDWPYIAPCPFSISKLVQGSIVSLQSGSEVFNALPVPQLLRRSLSDSHAGWSLIAAIHCPKFKQAPEYRLLKKKWLMFTVRSWTKIWFRFAMNRMTNKCGVEHDPTYLVHLNNPEQRLQKLADTTPQISSNQSPVSPTTPQQINHNLCIHSDSLTQSKSGRSKEWCLHS